MMSSDTAKLDNGAPCENRTRRITMEEGGITTIQMAQMERFFVL